MGRNIRKKFSPRIKRTQKKRFFTITRTFIDLTDDDRSDTIEDKPPTIAEIMRPLPEATTTEADRRPPLRQVSAEQKSRLNRQRAKQRMKRLLQHRNKKGVSHGKAVETKDLVLKLLGDKSSEKGELSHSYEHDANMLQDLDLVILAAPLDDYKTYASLLRKEYASMSDDSYKLMRLKVLETLLIIPKIYSTPEYQTKFEEAARNNIKWEINELKT